MLAMDYLGKGDKRGAMECKRNISLSMTIPPPETNPFRNLLQLQKGWKNLMKYLSSEKVRQEACNQLNYPAK